MTDYHDHQRRVLGMVQALADIDTRRTEATRNWQALQPTDGQDARALLSAAVALLLQTLSDTRLRGRQEEIDRLIRLSLAYEQLGHR